MNSTCPMWCLGTGGAWMMTMVVMLMVNSPQDATGRTRQRCRPQGDQEEVENRSRLSEKGPRHPWGMLMTNWIMFFCKSKCYQTIAMCWSNDPYWYYDQLSRSGLLVIMNIIFCSYNRKAVLNARSWLDRRSRSPTSRTLSTPSLSSCRTRK